MAHSNVLVTGGAGYVGAHACKALAKAGYQPVAFDNLSRGHRKFVRWGPLVEGDLADQTRLRETISFHRPIAVMHFAAYISAGESVADPELYFRNNFVGSLGLFEALLRIGNPPPLVMSSTAAVYEPQLVPISEMAPLRPVNPYGESKLMVERALDWLDRAHGLRHIALRYFNAAGADTEEEIGEQHHPETHLVPLVLDAITGHSGPIEIFGTDYPTPDGTAIRDYTHVQDLAEAHVRALKYLLDGGPSMALNLGTGVGQSVRQVIRIAEQVTGRRVPYREAPRRPGDAPVLVANARKAERAIGWQPMLPHLEDIIDSAWRWHRKL